MQKYCLRNFSQQVVLKESVSEVFISGRIYYGERIKFFLSKWRENVEVQ